MTTLHGLTDSDLSILKEMVRDYNRRPKNTSQYEPEVDVSVNQLYKTPSGGIAAATLASGVYTFPGALCTLYDCYVDGASVKSAAHSPTIQRMVYNSTSLAIKENDIIQTKRVGRFLFVDVGSCA